MQNQQSDPVLTQNQQGPSHPDAKPQPEYPSYIHSLVDHLIAKMKSYASAEDIELAKKAFFLAYEKHQNQTRKSGEPYFIHPYEVALILAGLNANGEMIAAGFLHDVLEDTDYTPEEMIQAFGEKVYHLVDGVTKLSRFSFSSKEERQAENFRRMFLAMAKDIGVVVIKLADRLHNMRTLDHMPEDKQKKKAKETLEIFAPLAHRLGIGRLRWELEDLCLRYLHPESYWEITQHVAQKRRERESIIQETIDVLQEETRKYGLKAEIQGRPKHFYSIYQKMSSQQKSFEDIYDYFGIRVIVDSEKACYEVLGLIHSLWKPIPGRFKDYIAMPKANMYQSLHTLVIGPSGHPMEAQIRTEEMQRVAEYGIAAHWMYKEGGKGKKKQNDLQLSWLRQLLDWQSDLKDAKEYIENVKDDLFEDDVYVFTPQGDVYALPQGSTPVDFAYRIHTQVGNTCNGAKINGRIAPLSTSMQSGDQVEILTSKNGQPRLDWMDFVATNQAKNNIRKWFKKARWDESLKRGRELLESEFGKEGLEQFLKSETMIKLAEKYRRASVEDLLATLGYGEITPRQLLNRIKTGPLDPGVADERILGETVSQEKLQQKTKTTTGIMIGGEAGLMAHFSSCCTPVPGEPIIGVVTRNRGVAIHSRDCSNLLQVNNQRFLPASWGDVETRAYPVELEIITIDRRGLLKDIVTKLTDNKINILAANIVTHTDKTATIGMVVEVKDIKQLDNIIQRIRQISDVLNINRIVKPSKTLKQVAGMNQAAAPAKKKKKK